MQKICIIGSGKMARSIGTFLYGKGNDVCFYSRTPERVSDLENYLAKIKKRMALSGTALPPTPKVYTSFTTDSMTEPSVLIETIEENLDNKKSVVTHLLNLYNIRPLLLSNSSSFLPHTIHEKCIGVHFFYPVQMTELVEVIMSADVNSEDLKHIETFITDNGLQAIYQNRKNAFSINRLLLPIQAEAIQLLTRGYDVEDIDLNAQSELFDFGVLKFIDEVGIDTIATSVSSYYENMDSVSRSDYSAFLTDLHLFVFAGKRGVKNDNGFYCGDPLTLENKLKLESTWKKRFLYLFVNTCLYFIELKCFTEDQIHYVLSTVYNASGTVNTVLRRDGAATIKTNLEAWYHESGKSYYKPCSLLDR